MSGSSRRELEAAVRPSASSIDGRRFVFQLSAHDLEVEVGGYVALGDGHLGQVHELGYAWVEGAELAAALADGVEPPPASIRIAVVRGNGIVLDAESAPFHDLPIAPAASSVVAEHLEERRPPRAVLDVGAMALEPELRATLDSGGFDRHTFFCGQSGSGKTYALGTVLERLILETSLRIVVLDPNSDFVRLHELREDVDPELAERYRTAASDLAVRQSAPGGDDRLHVRFTDCDAEEQAAVLRLDPIADREEYGALVELLDSGFETAGSDSVGDLASRLLAASSPSVQALGARVRNLGLHRWPIWSTGDADSVQDLVQPGGPRIVVVDLGSLATPGEKAIAAESVLAALWRRRAAREPVLLVIDEAHNVCPREPEDPVTALASRHAARIAAEGRKFGLYLLVSTQRPQRVNELVVSQCDNLVLMRMISAGDLAYVGDLLSVAPAPLVERASSFRMGESLVAGKIASHPTFVRFGPRISQEGGADVPALWAGSAQGSGAP
jgi:DNA helicase HerA-like ATPase